MDLKSAYSIVKEYTAEMKDDEYDQRLQFLQTAKAERTLGEKAIRKVNFFFPTSWCYRLLSLITLYSAISVPPRRKPS